MQLPFAQLHIFNQPYIILDQLNFLVKPSRLHDWLERVAAEKKASKKESEKWFMKK